MLTFFYVADISLAHYLLQWSTYLPLQGIGHQEWRILQLYHQENLPHRVYYWDQEPFPLDNQDNSHYQRHLQTCKKK